MEIDMRIITGYDPQPIHTTQYDWFAYDDETYGGEETDPVGFGETEDEAIADLCRQLFLDDGD
jgi:hypothetical protein